MRRGQSLSLNPDGSPCLCGHTICQVFRFSHSTVCLFVWKQRELKTFWTLIKFSGRFSFVLAPSRTASHNYVNLTQTSFWAHQAISELDIL